MVQAKRHSKVTAPPLPEAGVVHRPEYPVHGIDRGVSYAGAWVNGDQAAQRAAVEHVARMKVPMQKHGLGGIGGKLSCELVATSEAVDRNDASHYLSSPPMTLDPVLEEELELRERRPTLRNGRCPVAVQLADQVRNLDQLNRRAPL